MRLVLMHNPQSGNEDHSTEDLTRLLRRAGHQLVRDVSRRKDLSAALAEPCDLVVVAGGDGTVGKAAERLAGTGVPWTILPLGTANNVAAQLGITGDPERLVEAWRDAEVHGLDRGLVHHGEAAESFLEAFGLGAFPRAMRTGQRLPDAASTSEKLARDLELFRATLWGAKLRGYTISADGQDLSGQYLLVEVMNFPFLGPNVPLSRATPGDGKLDLILVTEAERKPLVDHLSRLCAGEDCAEVEWPGRRVSRVVIATDARRYHLDGELRAARTPRDHFDVEVEPHALHVLTPRALAA